MFYLLGKILRKYNSSSSTYEQLNEFDDIDLEPLEKDITDKDLFVGGSLSPSSAKSEMKEAFAEISFLDGNSAFERGDVQKAINHYQDALNYTSKRQELFSQIEKYLFLDSNIKLGSEQIIKSLVSQNKELNQSNSQGSELKDKISDSQIAKPINSELFRPTALKLIKPTTLQPPRLSVEQSDENIIVSPKSRRLKSLDPSVKSSPKPLRKAVEFSSLIIILFSSIAYYTFGTSQSQVDKQVKIKLLAPQDQATLKNWPVVFNWSSSSQSSNYILQIIDAQGDAQGKIVLEFHTSDTSYAPIPDSLKYLANYHKYKWKVIPVTEDQKKLSFSENSAEFLTLTLTKEN